MKAVCIGNGAQGNIIYAFQVDFQAVREVGKTDCFAY